jgi:two-component system sensor histidine kinase HydH
MALSEIGAQRTHDIQMLPRVTSWRVAVLAASIAVVSILRYSTGPASNLPHELSLRLYYIPILVSAYWYGVTGGLIVAAVSSIAYVNRVFGVAPTLDPARLAEVVVFHLFGVAVGLLASAQRRVMDQYRTAATTLQEANTRLRESHEQIRRIDRLKTLGEVAAGLAHEIRHPLASISGALEIIEARSLEGSPEGEFSRLAMAEVQRLDRLVWEFLRYARPHDPEFRMMSLHEVVTQVVMLLRVEAERAHVTLELEPRALAPFDVAIDPLQIEQVLLNVILNAIQATPSGKRVMVREDVQAHEVIVDVVDEGSGISPEDLPRVFDPFFTTKEKGTGLGLAIAHHIVVRHQGRLEVQQTSSSGTSFRIGLPVGNGSAAGLSQSRAEVAI